jgi:hypothetical protein
MAILSSLFGAQQQQPAVGAQPIAGSEIPAELKPYYTDILSKAQALYDKRTEEGFVPYEGPTIAQFTPEQEQAFTGIAGLQGQVAPKFAEAERITKEAIAPITGEQIQEAMSPYQQAVVDIEKREAQKAFEQNVLPKVRAAQVASGSFGGTRGTLLEAQSLADQARLLSDIQTKGSQAAFQDARAALEAERTRAGQGATQLANIAPQALRTGLAELGAQQSVGEARQQQTQTALDEAYRQFLQEREQPYTDMQKYQAVVTGAPLTTTQFAPPPPPQPSLGQQLIGGLAGIGSLYGTFTGKPILGGQAKTGGGIAGLVKRNVGGGFFNEFLSNREPISYPDISGTISGIDATRGALKTYVDSLKAQGQSDTEIAKILAKDIEKEEKQLIDPQVVKEQAFLRSVAKNIYDPTITEAEGTGAKILAAASKLGEVGEDTEKAAAEARAKQSAVTKAKAELASGLVKGDVDRAGGALAAAEKLGALEATIAKNASTLNKMGLTEAAKPKDAINSIKARLNAQAQRQLDAGGTIVTGSGQNLDIGDIYQEAAKQALNEVTTIFESKTGEITKNNINQKYNQIFDRIVGDIMGSNATVSINKQGGSIASNISSTSNISNLGNVNRKSTAAALKSIGNP